MIKKLKKKQLGLIDCNNFYVSCERLFYPKLNHRPVVVLSNNDGCVVSRSNEAKLLGIRMGHPWFQLEKIAKKNGVIALSSNYPLYADISNRVMKVLDAFSSHKEIYSIDECFIDLSDVNEIRNISYEIRRKIIKWIGIPVCVGIGPTKTLAKLANKIAKKHPRSKGVFNYSDLNYAKQKRILSQFSISEIWGIGEKLSKKLSEDQVDTILDFKNAHTPTLRAKYGVVIEKTQKEIQGISCINIEEVIQQKKQIIVSRSFRKNLTEIDPLKEAISNFVSNACIKLRMQKSQAMMLQVFLKTNKFKKNLSQYNPILAIPMIHPTNDSLVINKYAQMIVKKIWKNGFEYKKAGIILSSITSEFIQQGNLLEASISINKNLMATLDYINAKYGRNTITISVNEKKSKWQIQQNNKSPFYTTSWNELPLVQS